jgi:type II secretory pathway predicted ATPase ExeA
MINKLLALYGLKWNPFLPDVPVEALWQSKKVEHFCWRMESLAREGGFALITGDPGTGKSASMRTLAHHLSNLPDIVTGVLTRPQSNIADFYRELGDLFGVSLAPHNRWAGFKILRQTWLTHVDSTRFRPVLLADEAQEMLPLVISELRILASSNFDSRSILTVVLSGDNRLTRRLRHEELLPVASRIRVRLTHEYLSPSDLLDWLQHVLAQAGNPNLMTPEVMTTLSEHAAGNLRIIANMCNELLASAARRELPNIDEKLYLETFSAQSARSQSARA